MTTKKCDDDKILNPVSNRCVKRSGTIGKKIIKEMSLRKICKKDEILNYFLSILEFLEEI